MIYLKLRHPGIKDQQRIGSISQFQFDNYKSSDYQTPRFNGFLPVIIDYKNLEDENLFLLHFSDLYTKEKPEWLS